MTKNTQRDMDNKLDADLKEQLKQLTIARIRTVSNDTRISLGSEDYSSEDLVKHVEKDDEIGEEFIKMNWEYLKDLASGAMYEDQ